MEKKKIIVYRTNDESIEHLKNMLADSNWEIDPFKEIDKFLLALDPKKYNLIIAEEKSLNDDVKEVLENYELPVIFITDDPSKMKQKIITITEHFSSNDLKKAFTKASYLNVTAQEPATDEKQYSLESSQEDKIGEEDEEAVLLEPVFGENEPEEAVVLSTGEDKEKIRSSWEIPESGDMGPDDTVGIDQKKDFDRPEITGGTEKENKDQIFNRMDEIDNLIKSLSDEIANEKPFGTHSATENSSKETVFENNDHDKTIEENIFEKDDDGVENIFDDDHTFSETDDQEDKTLETGSESLGEKSGTVKDFEAILSTEEPPDPEKEWLESTQNSDPVIYDMEENKKTEESEESGNELFEDNSVPEPPEAPEKYHETPGESDNRAVELNEEQSVKEIPEELEKPENEGVLREEIRSWLEINGDRILREAIEERFSKMWEKK